MCLHLSASKNNFKLLLLRSVCFDLLTLSNEAGQELIKLLRGNSYLQWSSASEKTFWKAWDMQTIKFFFFFLQLKYEPFVLYSEEGWCLAVYQPSPAALSWLISLSVSLGHLLITNQKASLTSHKRRRTGADSERWAATFGAKINKEDQSG